MAKKKESMPEEERPEEDIPPEGEEDFPLNYMNMDQLDLEAFVGPSKIFEGVAELAAYRSWYLHHQPMRFGELLFSARTSRKLSQKALGLLLNPTCTQTAILEWEKGRSEPADSRISNVAEVLDVPEVWLRYGEVTYKIMMLDEIRYNQVKKTGIMSGILELPVPADAEPVDREKVNKLFRIAQDQLVALFKAREAVRAESKRRSRPTLFRAKSLEEQRNAVKAELENTKRVNENLSISLDELKNAPKLSKDLRFFWGKIWNENFVIYNNVAKQLPRPFGLTSDTNAYAIYVYGFSAAPRFNQGERIIVSPLSPPSYGDDVVVRMNRLQPNHLPGDGTEACIRKLVFQDHKEVVVRRYTDTAKDESIPADKVSAVHKILSVEEICGW